MFRDKRDEGEGDALLKKKKNIIINKAGRDTSKQTRSGQLQEGNGGKDIQGEIETGHRHPS